MDEGDVTDCKGKSLCHRDGGEEQQPDDEALAGMIILGMI